MPTAPRVPAELTRDVFVGSAAVRAGLLTRRQLQGATWRRLLHDVYVHRDVPLTHELRARAAVVRLPRAVITGRSAAVLWGLDLCGAEDEVEVTLPPGTRMVRSDGVVARRAALDRSDVVVRRGLRTTTPGTTACRLASVLDEASAVAAVDQLVGAGVVDLASVRRRAAAARGPGSARARAVAALADGLAGSPQETRLRLLMDRWGLPTPAAQFVVRHRGRFVARVDFGWPALRVAVEYDGLWHAEDGQFARDRRRLNDLREAGWTVVFVTAGDLRDPAGLRRRLARALGSALW